MYSHEKEEGEKGLCLIHMQVSKMSALYTIISSASHDPDCFVYFESQSIRKLIYSFNLTIESKLLFFNIQLLVVYILLIPEEYLCLGNWSWVLPVPQRFLLLIFHLNKLRVLSPR